MSKKTIISEEASKRIVDHMNKDHPLVIYATAKRVTNITLTEAKLLSVNEKFCTIHAVRCRGKVCETADVEVPFNPPLKSEDEARERLMATYYSDCSPKFSWIFEKTYAPFILSLLIAISYGALLSYLGYLEAITESTFVLKTAAITLFSSYDDYEYFVNACFYFLVDLHAMEALVSIYYAKRSMKLPWGITLKWGLLVFMCGFPIFEEMRGFMTALRNSKKKKE